jgi:hypothetical protein
MELSPVQFIILNLRLRTISLLSVEDSNETLKFWSERTDAHVQLLANVAK